VTAQQKTSEVAAITQQLAALKEQANKENAETRIHIEKRDKLNAQFKKLQQEIYALKTERDSLNEKVRTLKQQRDDTRTKIRTNIEEIRAHSQKIKDLQKKTPRASHQELKKELEDIEWKIQTTSLDLQEEKRLVQNVKQLETQLNVYKKIEQQTKKIDALRKELKTLETNADASHQNLTARAQKSQEIHANMLAKINESKNIKREADGIHNAYVQAKEQAKPLHEEIKRLTEHRKKLQDAIQEEDENRRKTAEQALKEKLESQARNKLQRGEKLSWNEFQLLADDKHEDTRTQD